MFQANDYVIYGTSDVCRIVDIRKEQFAGCESDKYYVLKPVYTGNSTIYAPVDKSDEKMRRILTAGEVYKLIGEMPDEKDTWIDDDQLRKEKFNGIIKKGDRSDLVKLIKTLHNKRKELLENGRKFHITDEAVMKEAEKLLYHEFALILDIKPEDVAPFVLGEIDRLSKINTQEDSE